MLSNLLPVIIFLPLLGCLFIALSRDDQSHRRYNSMYVSCWIVFINILFMVFLFNQQQNSETVSRWIWPILPDITFTFEADTLSMLLILAVQLAVLVGIVGIRKVAGDKKKMLFFTMLFLSTMNGFFASTDVVSFYIFFALAPMCLYMQIGISKENYKYQTLQNFFLYNLLGSMLFFVALLVLLTDDTGDYLIRMLTDNSLNAKFSYWFWGGIFLALVSRLPIWPFYYPLNAVTKSMHNPLVFININFLPAMGIYGFIRFWPDNVIEEIPSLIPLFSLLCMMTMFFAAFSGLKDKNVRGKLSAYITIYNLFYLSGVFLPTDILQINIGYSLFSFLVLMSLLSVLVIHITSQEENLQNFNGGILCLMPRASFIYGLLVLAGVGLPVTALFWNNFIILSKIYNHSLLIGSVLMLSLLLIAIALMTNFYRLKSRQCLVDTEKRAEDIDSIQALVCLIMMLILFLSFIKPLWFVL